MKIDSLEINGIGGITNINLKFDPQMNIICGPNGIGKTTILECIGHCFTRDNTNILKKNVNTENGNFSANINLNGYSENINLNIEQSTPEQENYIYGKFNFAQYLISIKVNRHFSYQRIDAIARDSIFNEHVVSHKAKFGSDNNDIKNWFIHRHLYSAHLGSLQEEQIYNFNLAKECFSALNSQFSFSRIKADTNDIMLSTPTGEIYYEYLSSGFKSIISILFGIIKEIEYRFKEPSIRADSFDGIILIDELELHLHPEWQAKIIEALIKIFPLAQFIVSTHSPHILQNAQANQIVALANNNRTTYQRDLSEFIFGFQGWTVEEILSDVMGMTDTRTELYNHTLSEFNRSIDEENIEFALINYEMLNKLLHPSNHLRKLLKLELASIGGAA